MSTGFLDDNKGGMERAGDAIDTPIEVPAAAIFLLAKLAEEFPRLLVIRSSQECNVWMIE